MLRLAAFVMPIDTVKLRSPYMDEQLLQHIEQACGLRRQGVRLSTGAIEYQVTIGELKGSWDSKISIRPMREEWVWQPTGRAQPRPSDPYIIVECSLSKAFHGHNVYGGPSDFQLACSQLVNLLEEMLCVRLPPVSQWIVRRVDVAETYRLPYPAIQEFFSYISTIQFPRRRAEKYGDHSVYFPGSTTTVKLYHKGPEFAKHDHARVKRLFIQFRAGAVREFESSESDASWVSRRIGALQRLANSRLRVEVEIHAEKIDRDFGHQPRVHEVTQEYLYGLHDREVGRLLREGKSGMETVREQHAVADRLQQMFGDSKGNRLFGFWLILAANGESFVRHRYSRATFYRNRRELEAAAVSWTRSNVAIIPNQSALPIGFAPIRSDPRHCVGSVRNTRPVLYVQRGNLQLAA
jgi:II/X family phage/plasmid replication protein